MAPPWKGIPKQPPPAATKDPAPKVLSGGSDGRARPRPKKALANGVLPCFFLFKISNVCKCVYVYMSIYTHI